jgi:hypothetical protein
MTHHNRTLSLFFVSLSTDIELFDDWLLRVSSAPGAPAVRVVLEGHVSADEVELHVDDGAGPAPIADVTVRTIEPDSDEDTDEEFDPDDGTG